MSLLSLEEFAEHLQAIEQKLVRERQEKQNLERRLENLMTVMEGLVANLPGAASGDTRTASSCLAKPVKPSEYDGDCANCWDALKYLSLCIYVSLTVY